MELDRKQCAVLFGWGFSTATLLVYMALAALGAGIIKILCSKRGKVSFGGVHLSWGN